MKQSLMATVAVCLQLVVNSAALAQPKLPWAPTDRELLLLPAPCTGIFKGGPNAKAYEQWRPGLIGHVHYCAGLNFLNRAKFTINKTEKRFNLSSAIGEFNYVLQKSPPNTIGLQQVQAEKDVAERMLKLL